MAAEVLVSTLTEKTYGSIVTGNWVVCYDNSNIMTKVDLSVLKSNIEGKCTKANNLSDLTDVSAARTNLGLGTVAVKTLGYASGNVQENGASLSASQVVVTDAYKKFITEAKGTAFNKNFGTSAGTVREGNSNWDDRYYTEDEIDTKLSVLVNISSETISVAPYTARSALGGVYLDFINYISSGGLPLVGYFWFKYAYGATEPTTLSSQGHVFTGNSYFFGGSDSETDNLYIQVKFINVMNATKTVYSSTFTVSHTYFDDIVSSEDIANSLVASSRFITDMSGLMLSNSLFSAKIAANMKGNLSGTAVPAMTPDFMGQMYFKTDTGKLYVAFGTSSSSDWKIMN